MWVEFRASSIYYCTYCLYMCVHVLVCNIDDLFTWLKLEHYQSMKMLVNYVCIVEETGIFYVVIRSLEMKITGCGSVVASMMCVFSVPESFFEQCAWTQINFDVIGSCALRWPTFGTGRLNTHSALDHCKRARNSAHTWPQILTFE